MPELPQLEHGLLPASQRYVTKRLQQCNWAQSMDGALDTAHFSFLHMPAPNVAANSSANIAADEKRIGWLRKDPMPRFTILDHEVGFVVGGARKADGKDLYWRITQFMLPDALHHALRHAGRDLLRLHLGAVGRRILLDLRLRLAPGPRHQQGRAREIRQGRLRPVRRARARLPAAAQPLERLPHRPRGTEAPLLHRREGHRRAGHPGAGEPGPHRRPHEGTPERHRHRRGALSAPDAQRSQGAARRQGTGGPPSIPGPTACAPAARYCRAACPSRKP